MDLNTLPHFARSAPHLARGVATALRAVWRHTDAPTLTCQLLSSVPPVWKNASEDNRADLLDAVVTALGTNDPTVVKAAVTVLAALARTGVPVAAPPSALTSSTSRLGAALRRLQELHRAVPPPQPPDAPRRARGLPGILSFVTALQYNPRSPLHLSLAIAALTSLIVHRPRPPVEIRRGPGRACAVHHPDTIAQLDTLPLDLIVNFSPLPAATCLATLEAGAAACADALRRAAGEVPARRR